MADISTIWDPTNNVGDWSLPDPAFAYTAGSDGKPIIGPDGFAITSTRAGAVTGAGLVSGRDIETAVLISIFTDAVADPDDQLPNGETDPRGWWADPTMGSKLWLLARAKRTTQTLLLAKTYVDTALAWLTADGVAASVVVTTEWQTGGLLALLIIVTQPNGAETRVATTYAWKDL